MLDAVDRSGQLAELCGSRGVDLLVQFGSSIGSDAPQDIDLAVAFTPGEPGDLFGFIDALNELLPGDHLDVMDLDRADPVARHRALTASRVRYASTPAAFHERQIFAINHYIETKWLRDLLLRSLAS